MPTPTYTPLANLTLTTTATTVTFSSISQAYRDLILIVSPVDASGFISPYIRFNSDSGSNYSWVRMTGDGSSTGSASGTTGTAVNSYAYVVSSTERMLAKFEILDYSATDKHKTVLVRGDSASYYLAANATRWANTAAITSITVASGTYGAGSTFALYGIAA